MGYTTDFVGAVKCSPALTPEQRAFIQAFGEKRRVKRRTRIGQKPKIPAWHTLSINAPVRAQDLPDPIRIAAGVKSVGPEGAYFTGGLGFAGQEDDASVIDNNEEPKGCPGLWCKWTADDTGEYIGWDGCEKFNDYHKWMEYLIEHFLAPWGVTLHGVIRYQGERKDDFGSIVVAGNLVETKPGHKLKPTHAKVMPRHSSLCSSDKLLDSVGAL